MKTELGVILVLAVIGGVAFALTQRYKETANDSTNTSQTTNSTPAQTKDTANETPAANVITYTNDGFTPSKLSVQAGSKVTVKNTSSRALQFDSDPHPEHTDNPELNIGIIAPGESKTVTVTVTGSNGYHNHLNSDDTGTLVVE